MTRVKVLSDFVITSTLHPLKQLSLTESEISKIGTIKVEGIINPTNAEMDLKEGVGENARPAGLFFLDV